MKRIEEILVIRHGALGDFVMSIGKLMAIRAKHPDAHITLLTQGWLVPLAKQMGIFQEFVTDSRRYDMREWYKVCKTVLADRRWDLIYDAQSSSRTLHRYQRIARFLTRHPVRWGRVLPDSWDFYCTPAKLPFTWKFATKENVRMPPLPLDLSFCKADAALLASLPPRYALIIPGCSAKNPQKRWPSACYRRLTEDLATRGLTSVVLGTTAERTEIEDVCHDNPSAVNLMGKSGIPDIPDLALHAEVVIGNDTGPTHMAHLAGARTVILFTDYDFGRAAAKVPHAIDLHAPHIAEIPYETVLAAAEKLMKEFAHV